MSEQYERRCSCHIGAILIALGLAAYGLGRALAAHDKISALRSDVTKIQKALNIPAAPEKDETK